MHGCIAKARAFLDSYPAAGYMSKVERWRELPDGQIEFTMRRLKSAGLLDEMPNLAAYVARGEARPAFQRAFAAQLAVFTAGQQAASQ